MKTRKDQEKIQLVFCVKLFSLIKDNYTEPYAEEIISMASKADKIILSGLTDLETNHAYTIYRDRYEIQTNVLKANSILGYEYVLPILKKIEEKDILTCAIYIQETEFRIFCSLATTKLYGILKARVNIEAHLAFQKETQARGHFSSAIMIRFNNRGEIVEIW